MKLEYLKIIVYFFKLVLKNITIELNCWGVYICLAQASMVDVLPVPGGP